MAAICAMTGVLTKAMRKGVSPSALPDRTHGSRPRRLTCYDKINPPIATYPIPLPRPSHITFR